MKYFICLVVLYMFISCQKQDDFKTGIEKTGLIDRDGNLYGTWEEVKILGLSKLNQIESDGVMIYFDAHDGSSRNMYMLSSAGNLTELYALETNNPVVTMEYFSPYVYTTESGMDRETIKAINDNGIQRTYDFDLLGGDYRINTMFDLGDEILIGGNWKRSPSGLAPTSDYIGVISKSAGEYSPKGIVYGEVHDVNYINGVYYVVGHNLTSAGSGRPLAQWVDDDWEKVTNDYEFYYRQSSFNKRDMVLYAVSSLNSDLCFTGLFDQENVLGKVTGIDNPKFSSLHIFKHLNRSDIHENKVHLKGHGNDLYLYGDVDYQYGTPFNSCFHYNGVNWEAIGSISDVIIDIAIQESYIYATTKSGKIFRYKK